MDIYLSLSLSLRLASLPKSHARLPLPPELLLPLGQQLTPGTYICVSTSPLLVRAQHTPSGARGFDVHVYLLRTSREMFPRLSVSVPVWHLHIVGTIQIP